MAIKKKYRIIPSDSSTRATIELEDVRDTVSDGDPGIVLTVDLPFEMQDGRDEEQIWLTTEEAHELRSVLSVMLGVATAADDAVAGF